MSASRNLFGFVTMGESYHLCARDLAARYKQGLLALRHDAPVYNTYAHSIELYLKAALILSGVSEEKLQRDYGHNLSKSYSALRSGGVLEEFIKQIEEFSRQEWRIFLRTSREDHIQKIGIASSDALEHFGIPSIVEIERALPPLQRQVEWISARHVRNGSLFRYHEERHDWYPRIDQFGLSENVVLRSADHFCSKALELLHRDAT